MLVSLKSLKLLSVSTHSNLRSGGEMGALVTGQSYFLYMFALTNGIQRIPNPSIII